MIEVSAVIEKKDITVLGALKGMVNDKPLEVGGKEYGLGELVFCGFVGRMNFDDRRFYGVVRFEKNVTANCRMCEFAPIVRAMDLTESEVDDGLHGDDHGND